MRPQSIVRAPLGYEQLTVSTVALPLAALPALGCDYALIRCSGAGIRYRDDGTSPTAAVGQWLNAGETLTYEGDPAKLKFIRSGATDATLDVSYYGS